MRGIAPGTLLFTACCCFLLIVAVAAAAPIETDFCIVFTYGPQEVISIPFQTLAIDAKYLQTQIASSNITSFSRSLCEFPAVPWRAPDCIERVNRLLLSIVDGTAQSSGLVNHPQFNATTNTNDTSSPATGPPQLIPRFYLHLEYPMWFYRYSIHGFNHTVLFGPPDPSSWPCPITKATAAQPDSFYSSLDAAALKMNVIKSQSTDKAFQNPNIIYVGHSGAKGRGVFASSFLPAHTPLELAPSLLIPSPSLWIHDTRDFRDAPPSVLRWYAFPFSSIEGYNLIALGNSMLYNHCTKEQSNTNFEIVRTEVLPPKVLDATTRLTAFAVRFYTIKDVQPGQELCWDYGASYWNGTDSRKLILDESN